MLPRVCRLATQTIRPLARVGVTKTVTRRHDKAPVQQALVPLWGSPSGPNLIQPISVSSHKAMKSSSGLNSSPVSLMTNYPLY